MYLQLGIINSYYTNHHMTRNEINIDTYKLCKNLYLLVTVGTLNLVETRMNQIYYSVVSCTKNANQY